LADLYLQASIDKGIDSFCTRRPRQLPVSYTRDQTKRTRVISDIKATNGIQRVIADLPQRRMLGLVGTLSLAVRVFWDTAELLNVNSLGSLCGILKYCFLW
jgi:hypothetical protein